MTDWEAQKKPDTPKPPSPPPPRPSPLPGSDPRTGRQTPDTRQSDWQKGSRHRAIRTLAAARQKRKLNESRPLPCRARGAATAAAASDAAPHHRFVPQGR